MKTLKVFSVLLFFCFSSTWAQAQVQSVNGWRYGYDSFNIVYPDATKSYFSGNSQSQIFAFKGPANMIDPSYPHLQAIWVKDFPLSPSLLDTVYIDTKFISGKNLKAVKIYIALENSNSYIALFQDELTPFDGSWKTVKFSMKKARDIGMFSFIKFYIIFVGIAIDGSDVALTVEVKNLRGMNPNGYSIIYDKFSDITSVPRGNFVPTEFSLSQNYPNPFNPATKISFALPRESNVTLKIYNVLGQEVETLVNKVMPAGYHSVDFNADNLPSGMYVYRIETENFVQSKKMILMK